MLHCNEKYSSRRRKWSDETDALKIKKGRLGRKGNICRVCLQEGNIPIYGNEEFEDVSEALSTFGDITVSSDDEYTKFLCQSCYEFLQEAIKFRKKAKESQDTLRWPVSDVDDNTDNPDYTSRKYVRRKEQSNLECKKCDISFKSRKEYREHKSSKEHKNARRKCPICNKLYASVYLSTHLLLHKTERPHMCDVCGRKFALQGPFKRHRLTHFYSLPFKCTLCPYKGRFSESLKSHMRSHTGEKPYQCSHCPLRFVNVSNLNRHVVTHTRNYNYKCDACGKGFHTKGDMALHFKVEHAGIKDHVCDMCGKAFGYRKQMMQHQVIVHKREKLRSGRMPIYLQVESQNKDAVLHSSLN